MAWRRRAALVLGPRPAGGGLWLSRRTSGGRTGGSCCSGALVAMTVREGVEEARREVRKVADRQLEWTKLEGCEQAGAGVGSHGGSLMHVRGRKPAHS